MSLRKLISILDSLSPEAQRQVVDFVAFLKKLQDFDSGLTQPHSDLSPQPFIGMWRHREDLKDSRAWLRKTRQAEWSNA